MTVDLGENNRQNEKAKSTGQTSQDTKQKAKSTGQTSQDE